MNVNTLFSACGAAVVVSLSVAQASADQRVAQTNLVSNIPGVAKFTDPDLVNAWGMSEAPTSPIWVSDNGTGLSTLYAVPGSGGEPVTKKGLVVTIPPAPPASGAVADTSAPTGQVFNNTNGFDMKNGNGNAVFMFASEDGAISAWNGGTSASIEVKTPDAVYKGLAISNKDGGTLYATNFHTGTIEAYNSSFKAAKLPGNFVDKELPGGYAPFNAEDIGGKLYVTYAVQDAAKHDDVAGLGNGLHRRVQPRRHLRASGWPRTEALNSPWGMAIAPSSFGSLAGDLLVGNFGNGKINAYNLDTRAWMGTVDGADGSALVIDGLWGLMVGNGAGGGLANALYFTAGPNGESNGLFGSLTAVPEPSTWAMLLAGFGALGLAGMRRRRAVRVTV